MSMKELFAKVKELIYSEPKEPELTPEEARAVAAQIKDSLITMRSNCTWAQVEVDTAVELCRRNPKGTPNHAVYRTQLRMRLLMQQYLQKMCMTLESVNGQIQLAQLSSEMGKTLQGAAQLVNGYQRDLPSFSSFVHKFLKAIVPMNEELNGGLTEFTAALDQLTNCTPEGAYSDSELDKLIEGAAEKIEPVLPQVTEQPAAKPAAEQDDLLARLMRQMAISAPDHQG